nr:CopD family protein [Streptomyces sp. TS71-3]
MARPAAVVALLLAALAVPLLGPSAALHGTGEEAPPGAAGIAVLRAVLFAALCVPVGEVFTGWLARRVPGAPTARAPASWAGPAAGAGFVAALCLASVASTGNLVPHRLADVDIAGLYRTRDGILALVEVNAFLLAGLWARSRRTASRMLPAVAVVVAEAYRAHLAWESVPLVGYALTGVHLTCAVLWAGGLWQVLRTVRLWRVRGAPGAARSDGPVSGVPGSEPPVSGAPAAAGPPAGAGSGRAGPGDAGEVAAAALLGRYARVAAGLLALVTATGVVSALRRMPLDTVFGQLVTTGYGRTLLAKVLLVAVAAGLGGAARLRLGALARTPLPARIRTRLGAGRVRAPLTACTPARAEVVVLGVVVVVSALLTALPLPITW